MVSFRGSPSRTGGLIGRGGGAGGVGSGVKIIGIPEAVAKLRGVDGYVRLQLGGLAFNAAANMVNRAKENVGKETGNLESGIGMHKVGSYSYEVTAASMDGDVEEKNWYEYAPFVEYGTSNMEGQFFMTRAFADIQPLVNAELKALALKLERL